ncbi:hypothetical protein [Reyranella sp.]|jgi:hypothetical protein|uniref:hypothetical protein n=1 Tax=Reyranella sp. TaxID=1929291 RepID=UPI003D132358
MTQIRPVTGKHLRTPRAAAVAGLLFAVLLILALALFRSSIPKNPLDPGQWLSAPLERVAVGINLIPFAGLAFLWFIGVVRDRLAEAEDRLFATVFLGSGLLFLGMLFVAGAVFGAIVTVHMAKPEALISSPTFALARAFAYNLINVYAIKMAGVFMMITSTLAIRTGFVGRWLAIPGLVMAAFLLFGSHSFDWSFAVFPAWVLLVSTYMLIDNLQRVRPGPETAP